MRIATLRLCNFQSFGPDPTEIALDGLTYVLGPNGAGKTAVLQALARLFSPLAAQRKIRLEDFHVPTEAETGEAETEEPTLWLEADVEIPEAGDGGQHASVPPNFTHMRIETADGVPQVRVRLTASLATDGVIDERIEYVLEADETGQPVRCSDMSRYDRGHIEVHYLPARRDPSDHISYTTASLIGRTVRAADWTTEREILSELSGKITASLASNPTVASIGSQLAGEWHGLHSGAFFKDPSIAFGRGELEGVLRQLTVTFSPSHEGSPLPFERLSDGQKSLLYMSLVLAWQSLTRRVLNGEETSLDPDRLRPPVHTIIAFEEPENSLAPQYLGRIIRQLRSACAQGDVQSLIATHAPAMLRRVDPRSVRFLRLDAARRTIVRRVALPEDDDAANKYVRGAVEAFPELYFSRFVLLGEGDSEQVVLPRLLAASGIAEEDASVSVVPLGGRHVNHFWRLLNELDIPYATLLDLDAGRHQGGWGRVRNALKKINAVREGPCTDEQIDALPKWNDDHDFPTLVDSDYAEGHGPVAMLEQEGVFFSHPIDLDLMMLAAYPDAYGLGAEDEDTEDEDTEDEDTEDEDATTEMDETTIVAVLGKAHVNEGRLPGEVLAHFDDYHALFDLGSKPVAHLSALAALSDDQLLEDQPAVFARMISYVRESLDKIPE